VPTDNDAGLFVPNDKVKLPTFDIVLVPPTIGESPGALNKSPDISSGLTPISGCCESELFSARTSTITSSSSSKIRIAVPSTKTSTTESEETPTA